MYRTTRVARRSCSSTNRYLFGWLLPVSFNTVLRIVGCYFAVAFLVARITQFDTAGNACPKCWDRIRQPCLGSCCGMAIIASSWAIGFVANLCIINNSSNSVIHCFVRRWYRWCRLSADFNLPNLVVVISHNCWYPVWSLFFVVVLYSVCWLVLRLLCI